MKSKVKTIIIFGIIIVLLAAAIVALKLTDTEETEEETTASTSASQLLYDKNPSDIKKINVTNEQGSYDIERVGEGEICIWTIMELEALKAPMNYTNINTILEKCASMTMQQLVDEHAPDLSIYGLDNPKAVIKTEFTDTNGSVKELCIGNESPAYNKTYFCFKGENKVYTANTTDLSAFFEDKYYNVNKVVYTAFTPSNPEDTTDYTRINKLTINRKDLGYDFVIEYDKRQEDPTAVVGNSSMHRLTSPVVLDLNSEKSADVLQLVFGLTASSIEVIAPTTADLGKYGFMDPYAEITMDISGGDFHMVVGNETEDKTGRYCMAQDINVIYVFSNSQLPWVTVKPLDLTTTLITSNYVFDLTNIDITGSDIDAKFTMTGSTKDDFAVKLNGADVDTSAFKNFYQYILKTPAEELYIEPVTEQPALTVTITIAKNTDVISFVNIGNRRSVVLLNGKPSFSCKTSYVERLVENYHHFENGEEIITTW